LLNVKDIVVIYSISKYIAFRFNLVYPIALGDLETTWKRVIQKLTLVGGSIFSKSRQKNML